MLTSLLTTDQCKVTRLAAIRRLHHAPVVAWELAAVSVLQLQLGLPLQPIKNFSD